MSNTVETSLGTATASGFGVWGVVRMGGKRAGENLMAPLARTTGSSGVSRRIHQPAEGMIGYVRRCGTRVSHAQWAVAHLSNTHATLGRQYGQKSIERGVKQPKRILPRVLTLPHHAPHPGTTFCCLRTHIARAKRSEPGRFSKHPFRTPIQNPTHKEEQATEHCSVDGSGMASPT